ncbi:ribonuclease HI [Mesorhizobium sp. YM1C-6-2]|nr:ribonuclease HI [Mesorhizobium sp. YM1C-6-2]
MANRLIAAGSAPKAKKVTDGVHHGGHFRGKKGNRHRGSRSAPRAVFDRALPPGLVVYADGCCDPNPGPGGWGFVAYRDGVEIHAETGGSLQTTNNVMEMTGVLMALQWLAGCADRTGARLFSDSSYVVNGCNDWRHGWKKKGWRRGVEKPLANPDLWRELDAALTAVPIKLEWCKGHAGIIGNERADELSVDGRDEAIEAAQAADPIRQQLAYVA